MQQVKAYIIKLVWLFQSSLSSCSCTKFHVFRVCLACYLFEVCIFYACKTYLIHLRIPLIFLFYSHMYNVIHSFIYFHRDDFIHLIILYSSASYHANWHRILIIRISCVLIYSQYINTELCIKTILQGLKVLFFKFSKIYIFGLMIQITNVPDLNYRRLWQFDSNHKYARLESKFASFQHFTSTIMIQIPHISN